MLHASGGGRYDVGEESVCSAVLGEPEKSGVIGGNFPLWTTIYENGQVCPESYKNRRFVHTRVDVGGRLGTLSRR